MIKIAFFVEGQTERIFIEHLLDNFFTHPYFNVESFKILKDRATYITKSNYDDSSVNYSFLIFDVGSDGNVVGAIYERSEKLINDKNYTFVFGLRDLFPNPRNYLNNIKDNFTNIFIEKDYKDKILLVIAIMETEAWFLSDYDFFSRINPKLTTDFIDNTLGINILSDDLESYRHPSVLIGKILKLIGQSYSKHKSDSYRICSYLDFAELCFNDNKRNRVPSFSSFLDKVNEIT